MGDASINTVPILDMEEDVIKTGVSVIAEMIIQDWRANIGEGDTVTVDPYNLFKPPYWTNNSVGTYIKGRVYEGQVASAAGRASAVDALEKATLDQKDKVLRFLAEFDNATNDLTRRRYAVYIHLKVLHGMGSRVIGNDDIKYVEFDTSKATVNSSNQLLFGTEGPPATSLSDTNARAVRKALRREERRRNSLDERLGDREDEEGGAARAFWATLAVFCILAGLILAAQLGLVGVTRSAAVLVGVVAVVAAVAGLSWTTLRQDILD